MTDEEIRKAARLLATKLHMTGEAYTREQETIESTLLSCAERVRKETIEEIKQKIEGWAIPFIEIFTRAVKEMDALELPDFSKNTDNAE